ncbi:hypothetical protein WQQ_33140 [Hydrocarboniphaga effusa AP103]|uniref:Uncharacterized protein n=1 Tax=Hydrocarboniphaga effusa AP103 TaxID=1172194 RepID=I7ZDF3_9GAMM|nr:hypothetical protein WQQ_33140 [Hydrocarboniphaga effusa AP103]
MTSPHDQHRLGRFLCRHCTLLSSLLGLCNLTRVGILGVTLKAPP